MQRISIHFVTATLCVLSAVLIGIKDAGAEPETPSPADIVQAFQQTLVDTIAGAEPSVVAVARVHSTTFRHLQVPTDGLSLLRGTPPVEDPSHPDFVPTDFGSGVVVDAQGLVLTHAELVRAGDSHWVTTADRKSHLARLVAADPRSGLAILSIEASGLRPIALGDASDLSRGQFVVALGNPFSLARDGQASASWGIVANTGRKAQLGSPASRTTIHAYGGLMQTDAKLNLGTDGGPILNLNGEMVGLTTTLAAAPGFDAAAGYAIPVDLLFHRALDRLKQGREVEYGLLGVEFWPQAVRPVTDANGVRIAESVRGGPAHRAGLRANDVITHINNQAIADADDLIYQVSRLAPRSQVGVRFVHREQPRFADVQLSKGPVRWTPVVTHAQPTWRGIHVDYATAIENFGQFARNGLIDEEGCVVIRRVEQESIAWRAGLRKGMFISHVAGQRVQQPEQFHAATTRTKGPVELRLTLPDNQEPVRVVPEDG